MGLTNQNHKIFYMTLSTPEQACKEVTDVPSPDSYNFRNLGVVEKFKIPRQKENQLDLTKNLMAIPELRPTGVLSIILLSMIIQKKYGWGFCGRGCSWLSLSTSHNRRRVWLRRSFGS